MFELLKAKRKTKCYSYVCNRIIERQKHYIKLDETRRYCLICGKDLLVDIKKAKKNSISKINKALRQLKNYPKEIILQKLE